MQAVKSNLARAIHVITRDLITHAGVGWLFRLVYVKIGKRKEIRCQLRVGDAQFFFQVRTSDGDEREGAFGKDCDGSYQG